MVLIDIDLVAVQAALTDVQGRVIPDLPKKSVCPSREEMDANVLILMWTMPRTIEVGGLALYYHQQPWVAQRFYNTMVIAGGENLTVEVNAQDGLMDKLDQVVTQSAGEGIVRRPANGA